MKNYSNIFYWLIPLIVLVFYWYFLGQYSVNIPYYDDYGTILWFYAKIQLMEFPHLLGYLFHQHNEHRLLFNRLIVIFSYYFLGELDLRFFIFLGNMALLGIVGVLAFIYKDERKLPIIIAISSLLIFNLSGYETMFWAMASVSNYYVIFFALLSFVLLGQNKTVYFILALFFACLSAYTQANGLNALIAANIYLIWKVKIDTSKIDKIKLFFTLVISILIFIAYFVNYHTPSQHSSIQESLSYPFRLMEFFFAFLGSISFTPLKAIGISESLSIYGAILLGCLLFFAFLYLSYRRFYQKYPAIYLFMLFLLGSAAMASLGRSSFGINQAFASRYLINSAILSFLVIISLLCLYEFKYSLKQKFNMSILGLLIMYSIGTYVIYLPTVRALHNAKITGAQLFTQHKISDHLSHPNKKFAVDMLNELEKQRRYSISKSLENMGFSASKKLN